MIRYGYAIRPTSVDRSNSQHARVSIVTRPRNCGRRTYRCAGHQARPRRSSLRWNPIAGGAVRCPRVPPCRRSGAPAQAAAGVPRKAAARSRSLLDRSEGRRDRRLQRSCVVGRRGAFLTPYGLRRGDERLGVGGELGVTLSTFEAWLREHLRVRTDRADRERAASPHPRGCRHGLSRLPLNTAATSPVGVTSRGTLGRS